MTVLTRAIENRLSRDTRQFNPANVRKEEFQALRLAGLVGHSGWYLSGAECWLFDSASAKRFLAASTIEARRAATVEQGAVHESATRKGGAQKGGSMTNPSEAMIEKLSESLFALSDKLRASGILSDDATHAIYERVVADFTAMQQAATPAAPVPNDDALTPEDAWDDLVNKTDRTSPEEYPDHALITFRELQDYMRDAGFVRNTHQTSDNDARLTPDRVTPLVEALRMLLALRRQILIDVGARHAARLTTAAPQTIEFDADFRRELEVAFADAASALELFDA